MMSGSYQHLSQKLSNRLDFAALYFSVQSKKAIPRWCTHKVDHPDLLIDVVNLRLYVTTHPWQTKSNHLPNASAFDNWL